MSPIWRRSSPLDQTLTRRHETAQALRNQLAAYRQLLRMHASDDMRDRLLVAMDRNFDELLRLEGMKR